MAISHILFVHVVTTRPVSGVSFRHELSNLTIMKRGKPKATMSGKGQDSSGDRGFGNSESLMSVPDKLLHDHSLLVRRQDPHDR